MKLIKVLNIQLEIINNLIKYREQLLVNDNYVKYICRNRQIQDYLNSNEYYLNRFSNSYI